MIISTYLSPSQITVVPCARQSNQGSSAEPSLFQMAELTYYLCFVKSTLIIYLRGLFVFIAAKWNKPDPDSPAAYTD